MTVTCRWALQVQVEGMLSAKGKKRTWGVCVWKSQHPPCHTHPHLLNLSALAPHHKGWAVSYCFSWDIPAVLEANPSQLRGISPSATCARPAWEQRKGLINDINDSLHVWLAKISCHVHYALLVPPDCAESFRCLTNPSLTWNETGPKITSLLRVSLQHSSFSPATNTSQHLSTHKSYELPEELPKPRLAQCLKRK